MKNIFNRFVFLIAFCGLFVSCSNFSTSSYNEVDISKGKGKICISTDLQASRSVLPTAITDTTAGLKWELNGTKDDTTKTIKSWVDDTNGTTAYKSMTSNSGIVIDTGTWDFTLTASLTASQNNATEELNVLQAHCNSVQINAGNNALNFVMQEATENAASGRIEFTLNFPKDVVGNVVATLYKYDNDNTVVDTKRQLTIDNSSNNNFDSVKYSYPDTTGTTGTTSSPFSAGYYILKIQLQQEGDATTPAVEYINTYSCLIRVAPGLTSQGVYTLDELAQLYTVTYKLNEGTFDPTTSAVPTSYNAYTSFELPTPTKAGYDFAGWYTDENLQKPVQLDESNKYKITQDTTLYAKWKISWDGLKQQIENNSGISEFVITEDLTATSTITVSKPFKITSDKNVTITRGNSIDGVIFEDAFFKVESAGNLELEGTENITITLDGGNANKSPILATAPLITSSGNLTLTNCILQNNTNNTDYDGGGGVYISGESSIFTMTGGEISGNSAYYGGGVYISGESSIFTMTGGEISGNSAEYGGGVATIGKFSMSGGTISGNKVTNNGNGSGVYVAYYSGTIEYVGTFEMSGGAYVNSNNDVYLANGTSVTVAGNLTSTDTVAATITPNEYSINRQVLVAGSGVNFTDKIINRFEVTQENDNEWYVTVNGNLQKMEKDDNGYLGRVPSDQSRTSESVTTEDGNVVELTKVSCSIESYDNMLWIAHGLKTSTIHKFDITLANDIEIPSGKWQFYQLNVDDASTIDGQGHSITIDEDVSKFGNDAGGLFYKFNNSTVKNLVLKGSITANTTEGGYIGALCRSAYRTTIQNVMSTVEIIDEGSGNAGGLVGYFGGNSNMDEDLPGSFIQNCAVYANITSTNGTVGGLVGGTWDGTQCWQINNCIYKGTVDGGTDQGVGAIIGTHNTGRRSTFKDTWYCANGTSEIVGKYNNDENGVNFDGYDTVISKTADQIAPPDAATLLGDAWEYVSDSKYPTLKKL